MLEGEEKEEESWITRLSPLKATSLFLQEWLKVTLRLLLFFLSLQFKGVSHD